MSLFMIFNKHVIGVSLDSSFWFTAPLKQPVQIDQFRLGWLIRLGQLIVGLSCHYSYYQKSGQSSGLSSMVGSCHLQNLCGIIIPHTKRSSACQTKVTAVRHCQVNEAIAVSAKQVKADSLKGGRLGPLSADCVAIVLKTAPWRQMQPITQNQTRLTY